MTDRHYCTECGVMVHARLIDFGIGPWEGHGRGWHHDWRMACPRCESTKLEEFAPCDDDPMLPSGAHHAAPTLRAGKRRGR